MKNANSTIEERTTTTATAAAADLIATTYHAPERAAAPASIEEEKLCALKAFLIETGAADPDEIESETVKTVYNDVYDEFEIIGNSYKVYDLEEADEAAKDYIKETLWAFNADFILYHTKLYKDSTPREDEAFKESIHHLQVELCESANPIIAALIEDLDYFVDDAICEDGRGNFLATYDGDENGKDGFLIYRTN